MINICIKYGFDSLILSGSYGGHRPHDGRFTTDDRRRTTPGVWHKLPTGELKGTIKLFADDTKIYRVIKSDEDSEILQNDLLDIMKSSEKWQLPFNLTKCKVMHLGSQNKEFLKV